MIMITYISIKVLITHLKRHVALFGLIHHHIELRSDFIKFSVCICILIKERKLLLLGIIILIDTLRIVFRLYA